MERDRSWRIYNNKKIIKKKLIKFVEHRFCSWYDSNGINRDYYCWFTQLNTHYYYIAKENKSFNYGYGARWSSKSKRYKGSRSIWLDHNTRLKDNELFKSILKEHGII